MAAKPGGIQVIDRVAQLLDALGEYASGASLKVISAETGLHPSTAFRILGALADHGFVERDADGLYRLGSKLAELGSRALGRVDLRVEARRIMEALRDQIGETVNLTVREGDEVVYIDRVVPNRMMRVEQVIGSHAPLHVTAVGKLMLGEDGVAGVQAYARRTGLPPFTPQTLAEPARLLDEVERSLERGFAYDNEEAEPGVGCIGVLVRDASGRAVAGMSISAPIERRKEEWVALLVDAGRRLSERLGYRAARG